MMRKKSANQIRHEKLIEYLSHVPHFITEDGKPILHKVDEERTGVSIENISTNDINKAVVVFKDVLNIMSGSAGDIDLYQLLQAYLRKPECRNKINLIVRETLFSTNK